LLGEQGALFRNCTFALDTPGLIKVDDLRKARVVAMVLDFDLKSQQELIALSEGQ